MAVLWTPPLDSGETREERDARYAMLAEAQADAANAVTAAGLWPGTAGELAAALVTLGWHESGWLLRVHAGRCRPLECDPVRRWRSGRWVTVAHAAASPWQLHQTGYLPRAEWAATIGADAAATGRAAQAAADALTRARRWCRGSKRTWAARAISAYATGHSCSWRSAGVRVRTLWRVEAAMRSAATCVP